MRKLILWIMGSLVLTSITGLAQTPPSPSPCGSSTDPYIEKAKGETVTICFTFPDEARAKVKYFRVRRSQTPAGAYSPWMRIPNTEASFTFTADYSCHIFISAVWDETKPDGSIITHETPGSSHIQVTVK
jgi:hypothetical protein